MFVDLDWPLNASSLLSASAELLVSVSVRVSVIFYFSVTVIVTVNLIIFFNYFAISVTVTVNLNNTATFTLASIQGQRAGDKFPKMWKVTRSIFTMTECHGIRRRTSKLKSGLASNSCSSSVSISTSPAHPACLAGVTAPARPSNRTWTQQCNLPAIKSTDMLTVSLTGNLLSNTETYNTACDQQIIDFWSNNDFITSQLKQSASQYEWMNE